MYYIPSEAKLNATRIILLEFAVFLPTMWYPLEDSLGAVFAREVQEMSDARDLWMVGDVLDAMSGSKIPTYIMSVIQEVQTWLAATLSEELFLDPADLMSGNDRQVSADLEYLFNQLEWVSVHADLVPIIKDASRHEDAIVLSVGPILLDEGMRMMVDHVALFASGVCKRAWVISDTWIIGDILPYMPHIRTLKKKGLELHFIMVTPWGYSEVPWTREQ